MKQKQNFLYIFLILVMALTFMPFITTFNDVLTRIVMSLDAYRIIQQYIVPWEVRLVGVLLLPFGFKPLVVGEYLSVGKENEMLIEIAWNCIGWQSLLFFVMTAWVGLQGDKYSMFSKFKAFLIGLLGTFLINLLRIALVVIVSYYFGQSVAIYVHDYGSLIIVVAWLFVFWWFSYAYVLEDRGE